MAGAPVKPSPMTPDTLASPIVGKLSFRWVGLGDSYGAGEGNPLKGIADPGDVEKFDGLVWGTNTSYFIPFSGGNHAGDVVQCHRSDMAAAPKANTELKADYPDLDFAFGFAACSGAVTTNLTQAGYIGPAMVPDAKLKQTFVPQPAQLDRAKTFSLKHGGLDALFMSIGGNNAGFGEILSQCLSPDTHCDRTLADQVTNKLIALEAALVNLRSAIPEKNLGTSMKVYAAQYGNPMHNGKTTTPPTCFDKDYDLKGDVGVGHWDDFIQDNIDLDEAKFAFGLAKRMNDVIAKVANNNGTFPWTTTPVSFDGHGICTADPYANLNSVGLRKQGRDNPEDFAFISNGMIHPSNKGYNVMAEAIMKAMSPKVESRMREGFQPPTGTRVAAAVTNGQVTLRWNDRAQSENAYEIEVVPATPQDGASLARPGGTETLANGGFVHRIAGANVQEYKHAASGPGRFLYRVRACNTTITSNVKCGAFGPQISGSNVLPGAPTNIVFTTTPHRNLAGTTDGTSDRIVSWSPQPEAIEFVVRRTTQTSSGTSGTPVESRTSATSFNLGNNATTTLVDVSACNRVGCSIFVNKSTAGTTSTTNTTAVLQRNP